MEWSLIVSTVLPFLKKKILPIYVDWVLNLYCIIPVAYDVDYRTLVQEKYPPENLAFLESAGIKFFQFPIPGNKEPFVVIPDISVIGALETILDKRNHPILVHCNAGKVLPYQKRSI